MSKNGMNDVVSGQRQNVHNFSAVLWCFIMTLWLEGNSESFIGDGFVKKTFSAHNYITLGDLLYCDMVHDDGRTDRH